MSAANDELVNALNSLAQRYTEYAAAERGLAVNDVLRGETLKFNASGVASRTFPVTAASITIYNESTTTVLVTNQPPSSPGMAGVGQVQVRAGTWKTVPLVGHTFTVYGRPGETVGFVALAKPVPPAAGALGDSPYYIVGSGPGNVTASGIVYTHPWASAGIHAIFGGFELAETAGAAAQVRFWDGSGTNGVLLDEFQLAASSVIEIEFDKGLDAASGSLYLELVSGALSGTVRVR